MYVHGPTDGERRIVLTHVDPIDRRSPANDVRPYQGIAKRPFASTFHVFQLFLSMRNVSRFSVPSDETRDSVIDPVAYARFTVEITCSLRVKGSSVVYPTETSNELCQILGIQSSTVTNDWHLFFSFFCFFFYFFLFLLPLWFCKISGIIRKVRLSFGLTEIRS